MGQERWEWLSDTCRVLVTREHGFTTDTLLLAWFSLPRPGERCADLGTGCGTIPLVWRQRARAKSIVGVELQEQAAGQARRSVEENGFAGEISILRGDAREYKSLLPCQGLDLMACNPPYTSPGAGLLSADPHRRAARHGESLTLEEVAQAARYGLRYGGRLCLCLPAQRLGEAMGLLARYRLEPKRLRLVQQRLGKAPYLFLLECRSGGRPGGLQVEPVLLLEDEGGRPTPALLEAYGEYRRDGGQEGD